MDVLGLACFYHDASAALVRDGVVVAAALEERFTRRKHDVSFPLNAARYCLREAGLDASELDRVAHYEKPLARLERALSTHLQTFPRGLGLFLRSMPDLLQRKLRVSSIVRRELGYGGDVLFVPHHLAHAAAAFLSSPFERAAVLTVDGVGEWTTTAWGVGEGTDVRLSEELRFPHSLGLLYSTVTTYLGFAANSGEHKVMGLAAYGERDRERNQYYARLRECIDLSDDGSFRLDMRCFAYHYSDRMPGDRLCELLGGPPAAMGNVSPTERQKDIAAALQLVAEDVLVRLCRHVHRRTGCGDLVMGGGVALNSAFNGSVLRTTPFKRVWIPPDPGDGGTSLGAAAFASHAVLGVPRKAPFRSPYLGPGWTAEEVERILEGRGVRRSTFEGEAELVSGTARLLAEGNVVGWFQGRMEWGPRALGNRSILADPRDAAMKEKLNEKVKRRERFRPFAPSVREEDAADWFDIDLPIPDPALYMLMVYPVREGRRDAIPAAAHADGSARLQVVRRELNPRFHSLINEFGRLTGVPVLVNTSFNVRGEPIVRSPEDAYRCMMGTGIDCMVAERTLVRREDNLRDAWDSAGGAKD